MNDSIPGQVHEFRIGTLRKERRGRRHQEVNPEPGVLATNDDRLPRGEMIRFGFDADWQPPEHRSLDVFDRTPLRLAMTAQHVEFVIDLGCPTPPEFEQVPDLII